MMKSLVLVIFQEHLRARLQRHDDSAGTVGGEIDLEVKETNQGS